MVKKQNKIIENINSLLNNLKEKRIIEYPEREKAFILDNDLQIPNWIAEKSPIKSDIVLFRSTAYRGGTVTISEVKVGSPAWDLYKAKYHVYSITPLTSETRYAKTLKEGLEVAKELMLYDNKEREEAVNTLLVETDKPKRKRTKPKLAFGYGFDPDSLRKGIINYTYSHQLEDGLKLYEFEPKISYRIFKVLSEEINFTFKGSELTKGNTAIKNNYFVTDQDPEEIIKILNFGIKQIFQKYEPISYYSHSSIETYIKRREIFIKKINSLLNNLKEKRIIEYPEREKAIEKERKVNLEIIKKINPQKRIDTFKVIHSNRVKINGGKFHYKRFLIQSCLDYDKVIHNKDKLYPIELYHTTTDIDSVCKSGLKPSIELENNCGLGSGGSEENRISFTADLTIARLIKKDIIRLVKIAKGEINWKNLMRIIKEDFGDGTDRIWEIIKEKQLERIGWAKGEDTWEEYINGYIYFSTDFTGLKSIEEWEVHLKSKFSEKYGENCINSCKPLSKNIEYWQDRIKKKPEDIILFNEGIMKKENGINKYGSIYCKIPELSKEHLFDFYRKEYLLIRSSKANIVNPIFIFSERDRFKNRNIKDIGIVKVIGYLPYPYEDLKELWMKKEIRNEYVSKEDLKKLKDNTYEILDQTGLLEVRLSNDRFEKLEIIE